MTKRLTLNTVALSYRCAMREGGRSRRCGAALAREHWPGPRSMRVPLMARNVVEHWHDT